MLGHANLLLAGVLHMSSVEAVLHLPEDWCHTCWDALASEQDPASMCKR